VFPLHFGLPDRPPNNQSVTMFPRKIEADSFVIRCDSRWDRVELGAANATARDTFKLRSWELASPSTTYGERSDA
jgi:hypothetical protein